MKKLDMTKGQSNQSIHEGVWLLFTEFYHDKSKVIDIGCGSGDFLRRVKEINPESQIEGADAKSYSDEFLIREIDFNGKFPYGENTFDLITSIEVIEHIENSRHFLREILRVLRPGGKLILSTPNNESIRSLISFALRGYFSAFGPKDYPAHINPIFEFDIQNICSELSNANLQKVIYLDNGLVPGLAINWNSIFPFLKGKRFSDNFIMVIEKR